jgi:hypothetical protein
MFSKTKTAFCVAIALASAATGALASNENDPSDRGGFIVNGSMDGVNPAYHPEIFGANAKVVDYVSPSHKSLERSHKKSAH